MANILDLIKVSKKYLGKSNLTSGNKYEITLAYMNKQISFDYHDNYKNESNIKDFLYSLMLDTSSYENCGTIYEFAREFGYKDFKQATKIYNACKKQYEKLNKLFNKQEQEELQELLQDY